MATEIDLSKLKSGDALYFKSANCFPYWTPEVDTYLMNRVYQNVLEGEVHGWGPGIPEQNQYRFPPRKWADDADEAEIKPSKEGSSAGNYQDKTVTDANGTVWLKVNFPFTFLNRDGDNHDTKDVIPAWVKVNEVALKQDLSEKIQQLIGNDPNENPIDKGIVGNGTDPSPKDGDNNPSSPWGYLIAFFLFVGTGLFFWNRKKKAKMALAYQQRMSQVPPQRVKPTYQKVKL
jgi:hypothetical protein